MAPTTSKLTWRSAVTSPTIRPAAATATVAMALALTLPAPPAAAAQKLPPLPPPPASAAELAAPGHPSQPAPPTTHLIDQEALAAAVAGKRIGTVHVVVRNVFDLDRPGEGRFVFRLANRLHRTTWPEVIEHQLLFQSGDPYSPEVLRETERLLRADRFLYDATVMPILEQDGNVDVAVITRDVWTIQAGVNFHRAGGTNSTEFDVEDENFLGSGKDVLVARQSDVDRSEDVARYRDAAVFGTHAVADAIFANNSDGETRYLDLERPFYALDSRWALGGTAWHNVQNDLLYDGGVITDRFRDQHDFYQLYGGLSPGLLDGVTHRFFWGFTYDRDLFSPAPGLPPPAALAADRTLSYPWVGYEYLQNGWVTLHDFDRIHRTEDLNLGADLAARAGWSAPLWGGDRSQLVVQSTASDGWLFGTRQILRVTGSLSGRLRDGAIENGVGSAGFRYYVRTFGNGLFLARFAADMAERLDLDNQLLLGGDNGLRGYPLRFESGDRRVLGTLEQRFYGNREYFHLVHLGAALFFDAGRAWSVEPPPTGILLPGGPRQLLKDIGAGLRLGSDRSSQGSVVHFDVAFPLDRTPTIRAVQYLVTTSETF
jgi:hypothetical protein